jgi:hypothetical protein
MLTLGCMLALWLGITGCGGGPEPPIGAWTEVKCIDDSPACIAQRQSILRSMLADRERRWVKQPATADAYASGVRLFAFKSRRKELSCEELATGRREAEAGPAVLRGPAGKHLTPAQVSRGAILSAEVSRELTVEMQRRCRA